MFIKREEDLLDPERLECLLDWLNYLADVQMSIAHRAEYGSTWDMIEHNRFESIIMMRDCVYDRLTV